MSSEIWKLERDLCRCCHSEGVFNNLAESCSRTDQKEVYCDMLKDCLDINVDPVPGALCAITFTICKACIQRLNDAVDFKRQVQACEEKFKNFYNRNAIKVKNGSYNQLDVKVEIPESLSVEKKDGLDIKEELPESLPDYNEEYTNGDEDDFATFDNEDDKGDTEAIRDGVKKTRGSGKTKMKGRTRNLASKKSGKRDAVEGETDGEELGKKGGAEKSVNFTLSLNEDGTSSFSCNTCGKAFKRRELFSQHQRQVHLKLRPKLRGCRLCEERVPTHLRPAHMESRHGVPAPKCGACGKRFAFPNDVLRHQRTHHMGERGHVCQECGVRFPTKHALTQHAVKHSALRGFPCRFCGKAFKRAKTLRTHVMIHLNERRHACQLCKEAFVQLSSLKYHMTRRHPEAV